MDTTTAPAGAERLAPEAFAERAAAIEAEVGRVIVGIRHQLIEPTLDRILLRGAQRAAQATVTLRGRHRRLQRLQHARNFRKSDLKHSPLC